MQQTQTDATYTMGVFEDVRTDGTPTYRELHIMAPFEAISTPHDDSWQCEHLLCQGSSLILVAQMCLVQSPRYLTVISRNLTGPP